MVVALLVVASQVINSDSQVDRNQYNDDSYADSVEKDSLSIFKNSRMDRFCEKNGFDYGVSETDEKVVCVTVEENSKYNTYISVNRSKDE